MAIPLEAAMSFLCYSREKISELLRISMYLHLAYIYALLRNITRLVYSICNTEYPAVHACNISPEIIQIAN